MVAWLEVTASEIDEARAEAESLMVDTCTANRPTGTAYDPTAQDQVTTYDTLFTSKCKVAAGKIRPRVQEVGGRTIALVRLEIHLPSSEPPLQRGDVIEITAAGPDSASLPGLRYRVTESYGGTYLTARRYAVEEVTT